MEERVESKTRLMIFPSFPFEQSNKPSHVEYEFTPFGGEPFRATVPLMEAVAVDSGITYQFRYRFVWNGVPGAWSNEGLTWIGPGRMT